MFNLLYVFRDIDISILPTFDINMGARGGLPFIDIIVNGYGTYNLFSFLDNATVRTVIHWGRDISGAVLIGATIVRNIKHLPLILQGQETFRGSGADVLSAEDYIIDNSNMLETHGGEMV